MFCSTVIPTIGRTTLNRAVQSVLNQSFTPDEFEVIVVNDSGHPLEPAEWQTSPRIRVIETNKRKLCIARNTGAAIAKGQYLHFLDDDDWILPGALQTFWTLAQSSNANWLHGTCRFVDETGRLLTTVNLGASGNILTQVMAPGQWLPIQSVMMDARLFFAIGGFEPRLHSAEDIHLCRRLALRSDLAITQTPVACMLRGTGWKTTFDYDLSTEYYRLGREMNLSEPGVFSRLRSSAHNGFWQGRIVRMYLASAIWNLRRKHFFAALSRTLLGTLSLLLAHTHAFSRDFWRGLIEKPTHNVDY